MAGPFTTYCYWFGVGHCLLLLHGCSSDGLECKCTSTMSCVLEVVRVGMGRVRERGREKLHTQYFNVQDSYNHLKWRYRIAGKFGEHWS